MSTFSRKYQNLIVASFLVVLALSVYLSNPGAADNTPLLRRIALNVYSPPLRATTFLLKEVGHFWDNYIFLLDIQKKNLELQRSADLLLEQNMQLKEVLSENDRRSAAKTFVAKEALVCEVGLGRNHRKRPRRVV